MIVEIVQITAGVMAALLTGAGLARAGYQFALKRNGYVKTADCRRLHFETERKILYIQYLLMETTTTDQQQSAARRMRAFEEASK